MLPVHPPGLLLIQANAGPWVRLAEETGALVKFWRVKDSPPFSTSVDDLRQLLTDKTKIVALPHVSNLLGEVYDVAAVVKAVRSSPAGQCTPIIDLCMSSFQHAIVYNLQLGMVAHNETAAVLPCYVT